MNKQLSVMGLAARASMVPVLIASGLTALAVGTLTYLANPEHTGGAAGVGAAPLAAAVGCLMVMVMLCLGGCGLRQPDGLHGPPPAPAGGAGGSVVGGVPRRHAAGAVGAGGDGSAAGDAAEASGAGAQLGCRPQSLMLLVYSDSFLHHLLPLADAAVWVTDLALLMANALAAALLIRSRRRGRLCLWPLLTVGVTMFTFTVDVADNAWMAMLLTALALMGWMLELLLTGGKDREE